MSFDEAASFRSTIAERGSSEALRGKDFPLKYPKGMLEDISAAFPILS